MKKTYVLGFAFNEDLSEVLLINKLAPVEQEGLLNGVGGKVEGGEFVQDAMVREFQEEVGIETNLADWSEVALLTGGFGSVYVYCSKTIDIKTQRQMEEEVPGIYFTSVVTLLPHMPNLDILIPHCVNYLSGKDNATYLGLTY